MEKAVEKRLNEMRTEIEDNINKLKINTVYLILQRKKVATKQEASMLGSQIRSNRKNIAEYEDFLTFLNGFGGDFSLLEEEATKEARDKKEKEQAAQ